MESASQARTAHELVHPIPQRRYAFIFAAEEVATGEGGAAGSSRAHSVPCTVVDGLVRPVSAPAGMHGEVPLLERPTSPLSRVGNPMVRDYHFRRGVAATEHHAHRHNHLPHARSSGLKSAPVVVPQSRPSD